MQGGGAHGAFTWGVLDRLLQADDLEIAAISGTSAGALNGAALKAGMMAGGPEAARKRLDRLWDRVGVIGDLRMVPWMQAFLPAVRFWQSAAQVVLPISAQGLAAQLYSPYAWGQGWQNPLEPVVRDLDFAGVCAEAEAAEKDVAPARLDHVRDALNAALADVAAWRHELMLRSLKG